MPCSYSGIFITIKYTIPFFTVPIEYPLVYRIYTMKVVIRARAQHYTIFYSNLKEEVK